MFVIHALVCYQSRSLPFGDRDQCVAQSCCHCIREMTWEHDQLTVCFFLYSKRSGDSGSSRNKLTLTEMMQSVYQKHFHLFMDWRNIYIYCIYIYLYIWLFLKEYLWRVFDITVTMNIWRVVEETPVECIFWHGVMTSIPPGSKTTNEKSSRTLGMNPLVLVMLNVSLYNFNVINWALPLYFI